MKAFSALEGVAPWVIDLTNRCGFKALEACAAGNGLLCRTLFPNTPIEQIEQRELARGLRKCLAGIQPAVVCVSGWSLPGSLEALDWCLMSRTAAVLMSESTAEDAPRRFWREAVKKRIIRLCGAALVGGSRHRDYLVTLGLPPHRIFTGYDVVDNRHFWVGAHEARRDEGRWRAHLGVPQQYFLASARFEEKKNLFRLLQAYAAYRNGAPGARWGLVLLGDGALRERLEELRGELGLDGSVVMPGFRAYTELPVFYGLASAFIHASTVEQWGLVVNEAMAAGLPVIVSDRCGCAPDLVEPGRNGFLFDPYDVTALARLMHKVASGECNLETMGSSSREIIRRWSPDTFAEGLRKAVEAALDWPRPKATVADKALLWALMHR
jgi:glycosyltransferase involved in cell wall biosynthesis